MIKACDKCCWNCRFSIRACYAGGKCPSFEENCEKVYCRWHAEKKHGGAVCGDWQKKDNIFTVAEVIDALAEKQTIEERVAILEWQLEIPKDIIEE
jgi:hypothetical protein